MYHRQVAELQSAFWEDVHEKLSERDDLVEAMVFKLEISQDNAEERVDYTINGYVSCLRAQLQQGINTLAGRREFLLSQFWNWYAFADLRVEQ